MEPADVSVEPRWRASSATFDRCRQFTPPFSFTALPSVTLPCGFSSEGLPIGLQVVGDHFEEAVILRIAAAFEAATDFHNRWPPICLA